MNLTFLANIISVGDIFAVTLALDVIRYTLKKSCCIVSSASKPLLFINALLKEATNRSA